jgi:hypothetical protein
VPAAAAAAADESDAGRAAAPGQHKRSLDLSPLNFERVVESMQHAGNRKALDQMFTEAGVLAAAGTHGVCVCVCVCASMQGATELVARAQTTPPAAWCVCSP